MKSAPGLRGLYPRPERRGFTPLLVNVHVFHVIRRQSLQEFGISRLTVEPSLYHIVESVSVFFVGDGDFENETAVGGGPLFSGNRWQAAATRVHWGWRQDLGK